MLVPDLESCLVHRAPFGEAFCANVVKRLQTGQPIEPVQQLVDPKIILTLPGLMRALSRGWVRLRSSDSTVPPAISANYGAEPTDIDRIVTSEDRAGHLSEQGVRRVGPAGAQPGAPGRRRWSAPGMGDQQHRLVLPASLARASWASIAWRWSIRGLGVHGVDRLRVADGSIMASIPSAKTHTTTVMIGERAAEFIKAESSPAGTQELTRKRSSDVWN